MSAKSKSVMLGAIIVSMIVGSLNSLYKTGKLPGMRFWFGNGILFLMLNFLGAFEEEVAKNIAIAIAVFVVIGEGGGVIDHFLGKGTASTTFDTQPKQSTGVPSPGRPLGVSTARSQGGNNAVVGSVGLFPIKPVLSTFNPLNPGM